TDEYGVRTAAEGLGAAHGGVDPELARLVVRGRDDAASVRIAADDERLRPELRILELLDRGEEGVEIEVGDDHAESLEGRPPGAVPAEAVFQVHARANAARLGTKRHGSPTPRVRPCFSGHGLDRDRTVG